MFTLLLEISNILIVFGAWVVVVFFASRKHPLPRRRFWAMIVTVALLQCAGYLLFIRYYGTSAQAADYYQLLIFFLRTVLLFLIYRHQTFQNLFFVFTTILITIFTQGMGLAVEELFTGYPELTVRLLGRLAVLGALCLALPPSVYLLRRLQRQLRPENEPPIWRLLWLMPFCLIILALLTSPRRIHTVQLPGMIRPGLLLVASRVIILVALWITYYVTAESMRYTREAEQARRLAENLQLDLERHKQLIADVPKEHLVTCGPLTLNTQAAQAFLSGGDLLLTPKEFAILLYCVQREDEVISREAIYESVWQQSLPGKDRALISGISRLRAKLEDSGYRITAVRGRGYRFEKKP